MLTPEEIPLLWRVDRREYIANIYRFQDGELVLEAHDFDVPGWQDGHEEQTAPRLLAALERGGRAWGAFDGDTVAGMSAIPTGEVAHALEGLLEGTLPRSPLESEPWARAPRS